MKRKKPKYKIENLIINLFIFLGIGLLSFVLFNTSIFNQFTQAFKDFTLTDIYYSSIISKDKIYKGPIVLINTENRSREEIAFLIQRFKFGRKK